MFFEAFKIFSIMWNLSTINFTSNGFQGAGVGLARNREGPGRQDHGDGGGRADQESGRGLCYHYHFLSGKWRRFAAARKWKCSQSFPMCGEPDPRLHRHGGTGGSVSWWVIVFRLHFLSNISSGDSEAWTILKVQTWLDSKRFCILLCLFALSPNLTKNYFF